MTLPPDIADRLETMTAGWAPERKARLREVMLAEAARRRSAVPARAFPTPGALAQYVDPRTRNPAHLQLLDDALVDVAEGRCNRLLVVFPPQEGKSTRAVQYGIPYLLHRNPGWRMAVASYNQREANRWGRFTRRIIATHGDVLGLSLADNTGSRAMSEWELTSGGGLLSTGLPRGSLTGRPLDALVIDDPIKGPDQADSEDHREAVWEWWTSVGQSRLARLSSPVVLIQTRWHEDDLAGRFLARDPQAWRVIYVPAVAETPAPDDPAYLADSLARAPGEVLPSAREGRDATFYEQTRLGVGERTWAALYQGRPTPREGGVFKWKWLADYRVRAAPPFVRVAVAVDPNAGGSDEAGVVVAGRDSSRHVYVTDDRSGAYSIAGWTRAAWFAVLDHEADVLVYEKNLVPEVMRRAIRSAWARMREQAAALKGAEGMPGDIPPDDVLLAVAAALTGRELADPDDPLSDDAPDLDAMLAQLAEVRPYADRILAAPASGPARLVDVSATRGKVARAEPVAQAAETGTFHLVGFHPELESQLASWKEGQPSPGRLDAAVWAWYFLSSGSEAGSFTAPATGAAPVPGAPGAGRVPTGAAVAARRHGR